MNKRSDPQPELPKVESVVAKAVNAVLDSGLKESTWAQIYPEAYDNLVKYYRVDITKQMEGVIARALPTAIKAWYAYAAELSSDMKRVIVETSFKDGWTACKSTLLGAHRP